MVLECDLEFSENLKEIPRGVKHTLEGTDDISHIHIRKTTAPTPIIKYRPGTG